MKFCPKCSKLKDKSEFRESKNTPDGLTTVCLKCRKGILSHEFPLESCPGTFSQDIYDKLKTRGQYLKGRRLPGLLIIRPPKEKDGSSNRPR